MTQLMKFPPQPSSMSNYIIIMYLCNSLCHDVCNFVMLCFVRDTATSCNFVLPYYDEFCVMVYSDMR